MVSLITWLISMDSRDTVIMRLYCSINAQLEHFYAIIKICISVKTSTFSIMESSPYKSNLNVLSKGGKTVVGIKKMIKKKGCLIKSYVVGIY